MILDNFCSFRYCSSCPAFSLTKLASSYSGYKFWLQIPDKARVVCANTHTNSYCLDINSSLLRFLGLCGHKWKESKVWSVVRVCWSFGQNRDWLDTTRWISKVTLEVRGQPREKATAHRCMDLGYILQRLQRWLQLAHRCNRRSAALEVACGVVHTTPGH